MMKITWFLLLPLLTFSFGTAHAEVTACKEVNTVPFKIKTPGVWCLKKNLTYSGSSGQAIRINKNNVVLDLNGFRVLGNAGPTSTAYGIYAPNRNNVTVRNGTVEGFDRGIYFDETGGQGFANLVEEIRAIGNYFTGIQVKGEDLIVRKNHVVRTGDGDNSANAYGIYLNQVRGTNVYGNTVTHTSETTNARGIVVIGGDEVVIKDNVVTDLRTATARYGVHIQDGNTISVYGNQITSLGSTTGIRSLSSTDILCLNNVIYGFNNADSTCDSFVGNLP